MKSFITITILALISAGSPALAEAKGDKAAGQVVFATKCKMCHGSEGQGNPAIAKALNVAIAHLDSPQVQSKSDDELKKIISEGNGKMKPVKDISKGQLQDVIAFVRTLAKR